jgi:hypothetical protein
MHVFPHCCKIEIPKMITWNIIPMLSDLLLDLLCHIVSYSNWKLQRNIQILLLSQVCSSIAKNHWYCYIFVIFEDEICSWSILTEKLVINNNNYKSQSMFFIIYLSYFNKTVFLVASPQTPTLTGTNNPAPDQQSTWTCTSTEEFVHCF